MMKRDNFNANIFQNPGAAWRGKPFWSWNGDLEQDELIRQIHILKEMGMGGYFMHSRTGLVTEYLGNKWFELTNACAEEGEKLGMESWLYDEDRWPSGTAGGIITENPDYRMKLIHMATFEGAAFDYTAWGEAQECPLGAWSCHRENEMDIYDIQPVDSATPQGALMGRTVLAFRVIPMAEGSFYNGNTYVDTMKRAATDAFIRVTHEAYKQHCGEHFGKSIKGIFTDEPHRGPFMSGFGVLAEEGVELTDLVPWTDSMFETFADMHGYRVEEKLPELFLRPNGQPVTQVKAHYADTALELFLENFAKPYYEWCEENGLLVTGHVLHENSLSCQVSTNGSVQRYYPWMHVPGIDYLCEHGRDYWVAKQVDSTARQFGQKWILSELYGCTGWQMNFESHRAVGAWQTLFGVNLRCHHLSWYTMAGEAKRDYPASILHQSPWYSEYDAVETWFSRFGYFRSQGEPCCDLLVLNPVESVWGHVYPGAIKGMTPVDDRIRGLENSYRKLFHILAGNQIDFDYGDEALLASHGNVSIGGGGPRLNVGEMSYTTLLISGAETIRPSTLKLIRDFLESGGRVIFAGDCPEYVDSVPSGEVTDLADLAKICALDEDSIIEALQGHTLYGVRIINAETGETNREMFCQLRKSGDEFYLSVLNSSRDTVHNVIIEVQGAGELKIEEWELDTGNQSLLDSPASDTVGFGSTFHTSQARCFRLVSESSVSALPRPQCTYGEMNRLLETSYKYTLVEKNICVLDTPIWSIDDGEQQPVNDILQIDRKVRQYFGKPVRAGDMIQPWFRGKEDFPELGLVTLRYPFQVDADALTALRSAELVMETPELFAATLNDHAIDVTSDNGWWVDVAFRRIPLPGDVFVEGANELVVTCKFREDVNLEALYLLGDFSVTISETTPVLKQKPSQLSPESIVGQGFPYYSGSIIYHCPVPEECVGNVCKVVVPAYEGAFVRISSGDDSELIPWRPNESCLKLAEILDIEICITRKNTFGPLHLTNPRPNGTGPHSFVPGPGQFSLTPVFIESGLLSPVELYCIEE